MNKFEKPGEESEKEKQERIRKTLQESLEIYLNSEEKLEKAAVAITRKRKDGATETIESISGLAVSDIDEEGVLLCGIDENGEPTASATIFWREIIDVRKES
ncbi:MAG: hypothetical protein Q8L57_00310 [bacterium]|nr:hypothetical protein [bacterium]